MLPIAGVRTEAALSAALLGIGMAALAGAWLIHHERSKSFVDRPAAAGEVGIISVFAQRPTGPVRLQPGRRWELMRPQDLSFQWNVMGSGPRFIRIELVYEGKNVIVHQETLAAPAEYFPLGYILKLDEDLPDDVELVVSLEAPHTAGYESRFPLRLIGSAKRSLSP